MTAADIITSLAASLPSSVYQPLVSPDSDVTPVILVRGEDLIATCQALQGPGLEYIAFSDVTAVDYHPAREPRFDVVYHLVSPHRRARVRLKVRVNQDEEVPSLTPVFPGAGWPEIRL